MAADGPGSILGLLERRAAERPDAVGYTFLEGPEGDEAALSFGELRRRALARSAAILEAPGESERIVLGHPSGQAYLEGTFACLYAGATPVSGHVSEFGRPRAAVEGLLRTARATEAGAVLVAPWLAELGRELAPELTWIESDAAAAAGAAPVPRDPPRVAYVQSTSGSTGRQRGVELSDANLLANLRVQVELYPLAEAAVTVSWLPMSHDMGFVGPLLQPLRLETRTVLLAPLRFVMDPSRWLEAISHHRATISGCPNFGYDLVLRRVSFEQRERLDLSSWSCAISGGEPIRAETLERFGRAFAPAGFDPSSFTAGYGLAEATSVVTAVGPEATATARSFERAALAAGRAALAANGDGRPLVGHGWTAAEHQVLIVDPGSRERLPAGRVGEIWVAGPGVSDRYAGSGGDDRVFAATLADGSGPFLRTGDEGFAFEAELFVTGRSKELILVRGVNHAPQDIEETALAADLAFAGGRSAAAQLEAEGEPRVLVAVEALAVLDEDGLERASRAVRTAVIERHGVGVTDLAILPAGAIPLTTSGKIRRRDVARAYAEGEYDGLALRVSRFDSAA